jgi:hypothetical protein
VNDTPTRPWLLGYRLLNLRLPEQYRAWVAEDIPTTSFLLWNMLRTFLWLLAGIGLYALGWHATNAWPSKRTLYFLVGGAALWALLTSRKALVQKTLRWQRIDKQGRPRRPKRLAVLGNVEAALLAAAVLVAFTGGAAAFGYGRRPEGVNAIACDKTDPATLARIMAGVKHPQATALASRSLKSSTAEIVGVLLQEPAPKGSKTAKTSWLELIQIEGPNIYAYRFEKLGTWTTFPEPVKSDRINTEVIARVVKCLGSAVSH